MRCLLMLCRPFDSSVYFGVNEIFLRRDWAGVSIGIGAIRIIRVVEIQDHCASLGFSDVHESARTVCAHPCSFIHKRKKEMVLIFFHGHQPFALVEEQL